MIPFNLGDFDVQKLQALSGRRSAEVGFLCRWEASCLYVNDPCGGTRCMVCMVKKGRSWSFCMINVSGRFLSCANA